MMRKIHRVLAAVCAASLLILPGCGAPGSPGGSEECASSKTERQGEPSHPVAVLMEEGSGCLQGLAPADTLNGAYRAGYEQFTIRVMQSLYRQDARKGEGVFFSPASVYMALGMAAEGMKGETLEQTLTLLGAADTETLRKGNRDLQSLLIGNPCAYFKLSNSIWIDSAFSSHVQPTFLETNRAYYGARAVLRSFDETLLPDVNRWVSDNTDGMIPKMLEELPADTVMLLLNTLLFDGKWATPFDDPLPGTFFGSNGERAMPMMKQESNRLWTEDALAKVTLLDYQDERTAMLVALPQGDIADLIQGMTGDTLSGWLASMREEPVRVVLPQFSLEYGTGLKDVFTSLGMTEAFTARANLSGMADNAYIGEIFHKTALKVGKEGTKAAAATAMAMCGTAAQIDPFKTLVANRPFLCVIFDKPTGAILFAGAVENPTPMEG